MQTPSLPLQWHSLRAAAPLIGMTDSALRKALERAPRNPDGSHTVDGVHGRKLGRNWRVAFGPEWCTLCNAAAKRPESA